MTLAGLPFTGFLTPWELGWLVAGSGDLHRSHRLRHPQRLRLGGASFCVHAEAHHPMKAQRANASAEALLQPLCPLTPGGRAVGHGIVNRLCLVHRSVSNRHVPRARVEVP